MRLLSSLPDQDQASRFGDYLLAIDIDNLVEEGTSGWQVWVRDDDKLEPAKRELEQFTANPSDPRYNAAGRKAERVRDQQVKKAKQLEKNFIDVRTRWIRPAGGVKPLTTTLIVMCCIVGAVTFFGRDKYRLSGLYIASYSTYWVNPFTGNVVKEPQHRLQDLEEIRHGQVWRLITPIFIHYGFLHLIFNMFWLRDLGSMIEHYKGMIFLGVLILFSAVVSNVAQYLVSGPGAGGMSGVVYALFGYIWMKDRYAPHQGLNLLPHTWIYMLGWLVVCFTGLVGPVANTAHVVGLLVGMAFGVTPHLRSVFR